MPVCLKKKQRNVKKKTFKLWINLLHISITKEDNTRSKSQYYQQYLNIRMITK